ncbi:MAG: hypothetical protein M4579_000495 [Chaenotheca gracillima]|nr:MAG: hypothetical protein M4579_000495 [Chaenotheca gracillima]
MRQRITYFPETPGELSRDNLKVSGDTLSIQSLNASKESRFSLGTHELPQELQIALGQCHEFHVRWSSEKLHDVRLPSVSRIPPGLHVFFTPRAQKGSDLVCPLLKKAFGHQLQCASPIRSFISIPALSERFSSSTASHFYQTLSSLDDLTAYLQHKVCAPSEGSCHERIAQLRSAQSLAIDYDAISHMFVVTALWSEAPGQESWNEEIQNTSHSDKVEVGVLASEKADEPEEISLGGFLTVVGEDDKPSSTLFSFPSRHHPLPVSDESSYTVSFPEPAGLHPSLRIRFPANPSTPPAKSCALHAYLTIPSFLFLDKYQLSDPLFLESKNLKAVRSLYGETDLEAPDWVIDKWGSVLLAEIAPLAQSPSKEFNVEIPLHLRYLEPNNNSSTLDEVRVPWPVLFWACDAEDGLKMATNPFDRVKLGYDGLFGPKTMFYHLNPSPTNGSLIQTLQVPVLNRNQATWVESGTIVTVLVGFLWVVFKLWAASRTAPRQTNVSKSKKST